MARSPREPLPARFDLDKLTRSRRSWRARRGGGGDRGIPGRRRASAGWRTAPPRQVPPAFEIFTAEALDAHKLYIVEVRHPVEVRAAERTHLLQWLSKRVGDQLRVPDLEPIALKLLGGRLLPGPTGPAAFFMYEGPVRRALHDLLLARRQRRDTACATAIGDQIAAVLLGRERDSAMWSAARRIASGCWQIAQAAYEQIENRSPTRGSKPVC